MSALTRGGAEWVPSFLDAIDSDTCIGCGRCYKVCGQGVLGPVDRPVDEDDDEDEGMGGSVMSVADPDACIGCGACGRVCAKRAQTYAAA